MSDQEITCAECGSAFMFREAEQQFYAERGLASPPKRCKPCRQARKAQNGDGDRGAPRGGGGGFREGPPRGGPRFGGGPRGGPGGGGFSGGGPRGAGGFGGGGPRRGPGGYGGGAGDSRGGPGRPAGDRGRFGGGNGAHQAPRPQAQPQRDGSEAWGTRPSEAGARPPRRQNQGGAAPANGEGAPRAPRARPERPKYDVTCAECGASAQVPFKPLEGRQVFCQPCYKARKGTTGAPEAAPAGDDSDTGIVE